ncbi:hypothetical protein B0H14DRAFT_2754546 [Mycena olivaceomarginata]|nr:hypothetical protein B0H14DRAFT_2754546 [Mycena olivaceomarginata]
MDDLSTVMDGLCSAILQRSLPQLKNEEKLEYLLESCEDSELFTIGIEDKEKAFFSGWFAYHLLFPSQRLDSRLDGQSIDLFVWAGPKATAAAKYFVVSSDYKQDSVKENPSHYIEKTVFMRRGLLPESAPTIAIHWCAEVPRITLFRQKFTCTFNWITASGIFVAYPAWTFAGRTMISHESAPLHGARDAGWLAKLIEAAAGHSVVTTTSVPRTHRQG